MLLKLIKTPGFHAVLRFAQGSVKPNLGSSPMSNKLLDAALDAEARALHQGAARRSVHSHRLPQPTPTTTMGAFGCVHLARQAVRQCACDVPCTTL